MQYLLNTDNQEKVPNLGGCQVDVPGDSCAPGFLDSGLMPGEQSGVDQPHACCPGYFCPPMLTCLLPCPYGAYCPRYSPAGSSH